MTFKRPISHSWKPDKYVQLHELVVIRIGDGFYSLTESLTYKRDEAILLHPDNAKYLIIELTNQYKSEKVYLETNRV